MGTKIMDDNHMPLYTDHCPDLASFSPKLLNRKKNTKKIIAEIIGVPKPPFRIMEPSGAPIRKSTKHAKDKVNFRCHSILCMATAFFIFSINLP